MIKVITSNIRFDNPDDGPNQWDSRKEFLAQTLTSYGADIIATQEGREAQLKEFDSLLKKYSLCDGHRQWLRPRMYPCLFLGEELEFKNSGDFWLSETPDVAGSKSFDSAFPRLCSWAKLKKSNASFFVFDVHLDHTTDEIRLEQAKVLSNQIKIINEESLPIILMGDFNTCANSGVRKHLIESLDLVDPWLINNKAEEPSFHMFKGSFPEGKRIDWVLISSCLSSTRIELIKDERDGLYLSDHYPVYCEISL
jgi:endonuclease/exonuclease/phosphatase family metal-dependent hydrolase